MKKQSQNRFIISFQDKLDEVLNKEYLIQNEIYQIELFTSKKDNFLGRPPEDNSTNSVFDLSYLGSRSFFNEVFIEFTLNGSAKKVENKIDWHNKNIFKDAIDFAEYYKWLKLQVKQTKIYKPKRNELTHKQKMLILYYLGLNLNEDKKALSKILYHLLDLNEDNTRKYLSYVAFGKNDVRTLKNLIVVHQLFDKYGFVQISNKLEKEIELMKKKT